MKETLDVRMAAKAMTLGLSMGGGVCAGTHFLTDGGDGFQDAMMALRGGGRQRVLARDPLGRLHMAEYLLNVVTGTAIIETAAVIGLGLVAPGERDIMRASSRGVADLVMHAVACGARRIYIGLGGSATCDGGIGMLRRFEGALLEDGSSNISLGAAQLATAPPINMELITERLSGVELIACCDVRNTLLGEYGTASVYAPQKGATPEQVTALEAGLVIWAEQMESQARRQLRHLPGAGAAGGLGFALAALGARLEPGAEFLCREIALEDKLRECRGMITCEGRFDESSFNGKAPWVASQYAAAAGRRAVILCGITSASAARRAAEEGITVIEIGRDMPPNQRRSPETFMRVQQVTSELVRSFR